MMIYFYIWVVLLVMCFIGISVLGLFCGATGKDTIMYIIKGSIVLATSMLVSMEIIRTVATFL